MRATIANWPRPSYGFATPDDGGPDLFVHESALPENMRAGSHLVGVRIECDLVQDRVAQKPKAANVRAEGEAALPRAAPVASPTPTPTPPAAPVAPMPTPTPRKIIEAEPRRRVAPVIELDVPDRSAKGSYRSKADRLRESIGD